MSRKLREGEKRRHLDGNTVRSLLDLLKAVPVDEKEDGTDKYRSIIDDLREKWESVAEPKTLQALFDRRRRTIETFIAEQKRTLREKEKDYKDIIGILTKAMSESNSDNIQFNEKIFKQSEKLERITQLEDIKRIKNSLVQEVSSLRAVVEEKQTRDEEMVGILSERVETLKAELETCRLASLRDGLTGLYTEQALNRYLKTLMGPNGRYAQSFSMMVIDIDNFDKIEEMYGSDVGQRIILATGQECQGEFNRDEFVARYHNGTFVVILPSASRKRAVKKAKQLSRVIAGRRYQIDQALKGHSLSYTVSVGVSTCGRQDTAATVTSRAIQALYTARRSGPNHVVSEKTIFHFLGKGSGKTFEDLI